MNRVRNSGVYFFAFVLAVAALIPDASQGAQPQALRDPTIAPARAGSPGTGDVAAGLTDGRSLSVLVVDGRPFVMAGSRLYAKGDKLGRATVERISETEIWLREGGELRKVSMYSGVLRRPHGAAKAEPGCGLRKAVLPDGSGVATRAGGAAKSNAARSGPTALIQDPGCKSTAP